MNSIWTDTATFSSYEKLDKNIKTDVLIIGGGITGLLCAYMLKQAGVKYTLVEADTICSGITKNTTAKITSQHGLIYHKLLKNAGLEKARMYLAANELAIKEYDKLCNSINCNYELKDSYVYSTNNKNLIKKELDALNIIGYKAYFTKKIPVPIDIEGAVCFKNQAQFNPLQFLSEISKDLNIYEYTKVLKIENNIAYTNHNKIMASDIIVATHFPFINTHGNYFLKMYQDRSYVVAIENKSQNTDLEMLNITSDISGMYVDDEKTGMSFRTYDNMLLIGGGSHRTGKYGGNYTELYSFVEKNYPHCSIKYHFSTQDCMTVDEIPYIGHYSKFTPHLYVATGFNKWGMTSSMVAAMTLRDMLTGIDNPYRYVFSPSRLYLKPQLFVNCIEATKNILTPSTKRCPHLGCALKWNQAEHTWDCPCHGSRFTKDGELIDNPATDDLKNN